MRWLGRYGWGRIAAIAVGVPVVTFIIFEKWFLVPLPKGLIEEVLGF
jgi:putative tricarboxylic transport membrane protein